MDRPKIKEGVDNKGKKIGTEEHRRLNHLASDQSASGSTSTPKSNSDYIPGQFPPGDTSTTEANPQRKQLTDAIMTQPHYGWTTTIDPKTDRTN